MPLAALVKTRHQQQMQRLELRIQAMALLLAAILNPERKAAPVSSSYKSLTTTQPHSLPALHPLSAHLSLALTPIP
jgi:hypothetical protein